jgi:hypothetical protein
MRFIVTMVCFPKRQREFDGFYVLYTAAAVKVAKGKKGQSVYFGVLILADSVAEITVGDWPKGDRNGQFD